MGECVKKFSDLKNKEVLALAIKIEDKNAIRYAEWADRFRPFNEKISRLLEEMSQEEILHKSKLEHLFYRIFHFDPSQVKVPVIRENIEEPKLPDEHFFVIDDAMSEELLYVALTAEIDARCFYKRALSQTNDPSLRKLYRLLSDFEDEHILKLFKQLSKYQKHKVHRDQNDAMACK